MAYFGEMIEHCLDYAQAAKTAGRPIVGIMCEYTPRELILAAGAVPVCLCGGSAAKIPSAEAILPANLCPLIKSTFGYHITASNPFLEMADLVVAETTCDGKKKMFEIMSETRPMYVLELPHMTERNSSLKFWMQEVENFKAYLEDRFRVLITEEKLRAAIDLMNRERRLRRQLAEFMVCEPPALTGRQLLECKSIISGIPEDHRQYQKAIDLLSEEVSRVSTAAPEKNVRVLLTGVPLVHGAERVLDIIEDCGATVVCMENCTGLKPLLEDVDTSETDLVKALAVKYHHLPCSVMSHNSRRLANLQTFASRFRPQCVIELVWQDCLTYDVESYHVRRLAEDTLGLPYLKIVTDYSTSDSARIKSRVEALLEISRARTGSKDSAGAGAA